MNNPYLNVLNATVPRLQDLQLLLPSLKEHSTQDLNFVPFCRQNVKKKIRKQKTNST